jgi:hypothetical protein
VTYLIALLAEIGTSWWHWERASTDGLRLLYGGSFVNYEMQRLIPWLCLIVIFSVVRAAVYLITGFTRRDPEARIGRRNW